MIAPRKGGSKPRKRGLCEWRRKTVRICSHSSSRIPTEKAASTWMAAMPTPSSYRFHAEPFGGNYIPLRIYVYSQYCENPSIDVIYIVIRRGEHKERLTHARDGRLSRHPTEKWSGHAVGERIRLNPHRNLHLPPQFQNSHFSQLGRNFDPGSGICVGPDPFRKGSRTTRRLLPASIRPGGRVVMPGSVRDNAAFANHGNGPNAPRSTVDP
jgi:hypothetical protein